MGKGEGDAALPQRGRGQDAVRRAAAARPDQRAAGVAAQPSRAAVVFGKLAKAVAGRRRACLALAAGRDRRISRPGQADHAAARDNCCRRPCRSSRRSKRPTGSTRTGRPRTGTGSTMRARAPRPSRCPTPGLSRWNSRAFICSPGPACSPTRIISNASASSQVRNPSTSMPTTLRRFGFVNTPGVKTEPAPASVAGLKPTPVDNFDGLPVGFSRMSNVTNPGTGARRIRQDRADLRGLPHRKHPLPGCQHPLRRRRRHAGAAQAREARPVLPSSTP